MVVQSKYQIQSDLVKSLRGVIANISNEIVAHPEKYEDLVKNGSSLLGILEANKRWARNVQRVNPEFFNKQNAGQQPTMLWIGCSDSRVPPTHITQTKPGDFFVHRNIGNAVHSLDMNANAVMQYSIDALKVKHVIVCGHYKCGAVKAGMGKNTGLPIIEQWIANIRNLDDQIHETLDKLDHELAFDLMCELNAITNARNACLTQVVQNAWKRGQPLTVHGWCYRLSTGIIEDLKFEVSNPIKAESAYQSAIQDAIQRAQMIQERMKRPQNPSIQTQPDPKPQRRHGQTRPIREIESPPIRFVTGPPHRDHWKNTARLDQDVQFHQAGILSRVCDPCYKESLIPAAATPEEVQEGPITIDINVAKPNPADSAHSSPNLNMLQMQNQRQMYYQLQNQQNNQNVMFNQQGNQQAQVNQQQSPALQQRYQMNQQIPINNNQTQALYYQQLQQQGGQFNQGDQSMQFNQSNLPQTQVPSSTFAQNNQLGLMNQMSGNSQLGGTAQVPGAFSAQNFVNNNQSPTTPQVALSSIQSPQSHGNVYQQTQFTPTVNSMTTFQGPQAQLNERSYFENAFNSFLRQRNPAARVPPLDGKPLDTFLAFHVVIQDGGFEKVRNQNSWPAICHKLGIDVNPMNITTLQAAYQTFLYPLEQMVNRSAIQRPSSAQSNPNISAMSPAMASTPGLYNNNYMNANQPPTIPKPQTPPLPKAPPVIPEAKVVPPEPIDPATYYPKAVKLQSFGGIDLTTLGAALHRVRPAKEHYAPKDLRKLNMSLKSKMPLQVKFALDCLSIYSAEFNLKFAEYPDLLNSLVYHMEDCLKRSTEKRSNDKFYSYKELFEYEWNSISQLQDNCVGSIDVVKNLMEEATTIGLILRNASMHPENHALMSQKEDLVQMLFWTLNLPVPEAIAHLDKSVSGTILSYPVFHVLEHRKNAVIILSNIGHNITIPNDKYAQLLIDVCTDFISEANTYYVYPATDLLARVLLQSTNQILIGACSKLLDLANVLLKNLPWTGLPIDAQPSQLALWELTMLNLNSIIGLAPAEQKSEIIAIPSLMKVLYLLSKRPVAQYAVPPELLMQFTGIRERSFRTYIECTRFSGKHSKKIETELLQRMVIAQRDQEAWLVAQILDFLSDYGE